MQQPIARLDAYAPGLSSVLGGRTVEAESVSIKRSLPDPVMGESLTAALGTVRAVEGDDVSRTVATPWDPGSQWPPVPESSASVSMDMGAGPVGLLSNGRTVSSSGGTDGRAVSVTVSDQYQSLDRTISWDNVAAAMPGLAERSNSRYVSMLTTSIVDMVLRECGWFATPPRIGFTALSVPAMGTMWPERGSVTACGRESDVNYGGFPAWPTTSWGMGVSDCRADYALAGAYSVKSRGRVELCAVTTAPTAMSRIEVSNSGGAGLYRLQWTASTAYLQARNSLGAFENLVTVPRADGFLYGTIEHVPGSGADQVRGIIRCGGVTNVSAVTAVSSSVVPA